MIFRKAIPIGYLSFGQHRAMSGSWEEAEMTFRGKRYVDAVHRRNQRSPRDGMCPDL